MWRGGLSERRTAPFGCEAVVIVASVICLNKHGTASRSNGGKPPRHTSPSPQGNSVVATSWCIPLATSSATLYPEVIGRLWSAASGH
ncbi:hypothetical protein EMIT0P291_140014 [Pseudomonas sp. IT-P291]